MSRTKKSIALAIPVVAAGIFAANADETRTFDFTKFDKIESQSGMKVTVTQADEFSVDAVATEGKYFEKLEIEVKDGRLIVQRKSENLFGAIFSWSDAKNTPEVNVSMPILIEAVAESGSELNIGNFEGGRLDMRAESGARLIADQLNYGSLTLDASSGAEMTTRGNCEKLKIEATTGSEIEAKGLDCQNVTLDVNTGASLGVQANGLLKASASTGGSAEILGSPTKTEIGQTFGGDIQISN